MSVDDPFIDDGVTDGAPPPEAAVMALVSSLPLSPIPLIGQSTADIASCLLFPTEHLLTTGCSRVLHSCAYVRLVDDRGR